MEALEAMDAALSLLPSLLALPSLKPPEVLLFTLLALRWALLLLLLLVLPPPSAPTPPCACSTSDIRLYALNTQCPPRDTPQGLSLGEDAWCQVWTNPENPIRERPHAAYPHAIDCQCFRGRGSPCSCRLPPPPPPPPPGGGMGGGMGGGIGTSGLPGSGFGGPAVSAPGTYSFSSPSRASAAAAATPSPHSASPAAPRTAAAPPPLSLQAQPARREAQDPPYNREAVREQQWGLLRQQHSAPLAPLPAPWPQHPATTSLFAPGPQHSAPQLPAGAAVPSAPSDEEGRALQLSYETYRAEERARAEHAAAAARAQAAAEQGSSAALDRLMEEERERLRRRWEWHQQQAPQGLQDLQAPQAAGPVGGAQGEQGECAPPRAAEGGLDILWWLGGLVAAAWAIALAAQFAASSGK